MSKNRVQRKQIQAEEVQEVFDLLKAEEALHDHINSNPAFYKKLQKLVEARNTKLEAAEKVVRGMGVECGPFVIHTQTVDINTEGLYDELGPDNFQQVGGYTETQTMYKIDRTRFLSHLEAGHVPKEVADSCVKDKISYKKPYPYNIP